MTTFARMTDIARRPCPGCLATDARLVGPKNGFDIYVCNDCRSLFTATLPTEDESEDYDAYYSESNLSVPDFITKRLKEIIGGFESYKSNGRLLDIGFGAGSIMDVAEKLGWTVFGQEVSATAVENARQKGFDVFLGDLTNAQYPEAHFDVVTCSEIVEHVPDPQAMLDEIARILRPGGLLWATTPSARSMSFRLMKQRWTVISPPEHTQLYSARGVRKMLQKARFRQIKIQTLGLNPTELINFYRTPPSEDKGFDRVATAYGLNEQLTGSLKGRIAKAGANIVLNGLGLGDSLKIFAVK